MRRWLLLSRPQKLALHLQLDRTGGLLFHRHAQRLLLWQQTGCFPLVWWKLEWRVRDGLSGAVPHLKALIVQELVCDSFSQRSAPVIIIREALGMDVAIATAYLALRFNGTVSGYLMVIRQHQAANADTFIAVLLDFSLSYLAVSLENLLGELEELMQTVSLANLV